MDPDRWGKLEALYEAALGVEPDRRSAFLAEQCAGDEALRQEVESLLFHGESAGDFLRAPAPVKPLEAGQRVTHYEIQQKLGEGGMGAVYRAYDSQLRRPVALKVLPPEFAADPERRQRLLREARAASALTHPNIVGVYEVGSDNGVDFIAMEFVEGKTLEEIIPAKGLPLAKALDYGAQIAAGLARAHSAGVIHRDLKPGNIMVTRDGLVKLLDFGLARRVRLEPGQATTLTVEGEIAGTPAYMSPEQAEGKALDARSDVFSFGLVLYRMLTGRQAFSGDTAASVMAAVLREEPAPLGDKVPREVERIVRRCLRKDPAQRFQHIDDVKVELDEWKEECTIPSALPGSFPTRRARYRWLIAAASLLLAGAAGVTWRLNRSPIPAAAPVITRLTTDSGLTTDPALSPDGKLLAYASDRSGEGNLDIWVRQVPNGEPVCVTRDPADESAPDFSPDSTQIAFRSERQGGGIYVIPALGGEPRLVAREGRRPRFSPNGEWIAYWTGPTYDSSFPRSYRMFVVPVSGGASRQLRGEFDLARFPTWSPDGKHILFYGSLRAPGSGKEEYDWWVTPLDGGTATRTGVFEALRNQGLSGYLEPGVWHARESQVVFSATLGDSTNLWRVLIRPSTLKLEGVPERLTYAEGVEGQPSLAAALPGTRLAFMALVSNDDLWRLPMDANQGKPTGPMERVTQDAAADWVPDLSPDGRRVAFVSKRRGNPDVWIKDLGSGRETALTLTAEPEQIPVFSPDGSKIAYTVGDLQQKLGVYAIPSVGGAAEKLCEDCGAAYDWSSDGKWVIVRSQGQPRRLRLLSPESGQIKDFLQNPGYSFYTPRLSPENGWLAALARRGPTQWCLRLIPFRPDAPTVDESEWIRIADEADRIGYRWSPDGHILYFASFRDGKHCIWAQRLDPATKRPVGEPWAVYHAHSARFRVGGGDTAIALARHAPGAGMVLVMNETTGNIWMAEWKTR